MNKPYIMNTSTTTNHLSNTAKAVLILLPSLILIGDFLRDSPNANVALVGKILPFASLILAIVLAIMQRIKLVYIIIYLIIGALFFAYPYVFKN